MTITDHYDACFVINLARRQDRMAEFWYEAWKNFGVPYHFIQRWEGDDMQSQGNHGCTMSHRKLLRHIADSATINRALVLEDDVSLITKCVLQTNNFHPSVSVLPVWERHCSILDGNGTLSERFNCFEIPDYDVLYLGAGYAEKPIRRINEHIIQVGRMFTTSSYGITKKFAQTWTERVGFDLDSHPGAIDQVFGSFSHEFTYLCLQPRLTYQRKSYSDLNGGTNSYLQSMCDPTHENML